MYVSQFNSLKALPVRCFSYIVLDYINENADYRYDLYTQFNRYNLYTVVFWLGLPWLYRSSYQIHVKNAHMSRLPYVCPSASDIILTDSVKINQYIGPVLLIWFNFKLSMDK